MNEIQSNHASEPFASGAKGHRFESYRAYHPLPRSPLGSTPQHQDEPEADQAVCQQKVFKPGIVRECSRLEIGGQTAIIPSFLPVRGWEIDRSRKGYLRWNSTRGIKRRARAHRLVIEMLAGRTLAEDEHVHHQDFNKLNNCPCNLILMPACLNPSPSRRDPHTGAFLSVSEFMRRYRQ